MAYYNTSNSTKTIKFLLIVTTKTGTQESQDRIHESTANKIWKYAYHQTGGR